MRRQEALVKADPLELWIILDEAVIRRAMGPPDLMQRQLAHLVEASQRPNMTLQVLEFSSGLHPALNGPFAIIEFPERFDPDVVYSEGVVGQAYVEEREKEVKAQVEAFDLLRATALPPADSVEPHPHPASQCHLIRGKDHPGMNPDMSSVTWSPAAPATTRRCVQVAHLPGGIVAFVIPRTPASPRTSLTADEWSSFLSGSQERRIRPAGAS